LEAVPNWLLFGAIKVHCEILPVVSAVRFLHLVKKAGIVDLSSTKPLEKIEIKDLTERPFNISLDKNSMQTYVSKTARFRAGFFTSSHV
jgi:hypothetical protein